MARRETARSLAAYFILVGLANAYLTYMQASRMGGYNLAVILNILPVAVYLGVGLAFKKLLLSRPGVIYGAIFGVAALQLIFGALSFTRGGMELFGGLYYLAFTLAIAAYLALNVRRLVREERDKGPAGSPMIG